MAHPSQNSLKISLRQQAAYVVDGPNSATVRKGQKTPDSGFPFVSTSGFVWAYAVYSNQTSTTGVFIPTTDLHRVDGAGSGASWNTLSALRNAADSDITLYYGGYEGPDFTVPACRGVVIENRNAVAIYARKGTPNASGVVVAKAGDTNGDDVQGIEIPANGSLVLEPGNFSPGEEWHILGTAASQTAIVNFL